MAKVHEQIFTILNTDEKHKNSEDAQLTNIKHMIKSHCKRHSDTDKRTDGEGLSIMRMLVGND